MGYPQPRNYRGEITQINADFGRRFIARGGMVRAV